MFFNQKKSCVVLSGILLLSLSIIFLNSYAGIEADSIDSSSSEKTHHQQPNIVNLKFYKTDLPVEGESNNVQSNYVQWF